jgi:hypothetical protein
VKKEYFFISLILVIGLIYRLTRSEFSPDSDILTYTALIQLVLLIIFCLFQIRNEKRPYIIVLISLLIIGFCGDILNVFRLPGRGLIMSFGELAAILMLIQIIIDNLKMKDIYLQIFGFIMGLSILTQFVLTLVFESNESYLLNFLVLTAGLLLIIRKIKKTNVVETYLKILTLQYALGSITAIIFMIEK